MDSEEKQKTVLVVDDEPQIRQLLNTYLSRKGFHVIEKENGRLALEHIEENRCSSPDVVVSDLIMPELDGVTLATQVVRTCPEMKIVLMSAHALPEHLELDAPRHTWMFVPKPLIPHSVMDAIHKLLHG